MITVMGASGHTGGEVARRLLRAGRPVRAVGRSAARLAGLAAAGAEVCAGDAADAAFLTAAFRGADAVYAMLPFDPAEPDHMASQRRLGEATVTALRAAGVPAAVALSAVGAGQPASARTGFLASLHEQETRLGGGRRRYGRAPAALRPLLREPDRRPAPDRGAGVQRRRRRPGRPPAGRSPPRMWAAAAARPCWRGTGRAWSCASCSARAT